eukprot:scaffold181096_cov33-Tisochrysis_lutea.AAC.1
MRRGTRSPGLGCTHRRGDKRDVLMCRARHACARECPPHCRRGRREPSTRPRPPPAQHSSMSEAARAARRYARPPPTWLEVGLLGREGGAGGRLARRPRARGQRRERKRLLLVALRLSYKE